MTKKEYYAKRKELIDEAQSFIDSGKIKEANEKTQEVKELDANFENVAKAQANINALSGNNSTAIKNFIDEGEKSMNTGENIVTDNFNTVEYRKAFMNYVQTGKQTPALTNSDANTKTTDVGSVIPTTVLNRIIEKMEEKSVILPLITRTSYKGGVSIPTAGVKPTASWVSEGAGSDKQKVATGSITFAYNKLRCAVSSSLEVETMSLSAFESYFVKTVSDAMVKALETSIIKGTGSGQPKGILTETPDTGKKIEIAAGAALTYKIICQLEAALPSEYEAGTSWFMSKKTFMEFVAITDTAGNPIARTNYGIAGRPERTLLGRNVVLTENVDSFSAAPAADTIVAFMFRPEDYILNTNLDMTIKTYEDNDTDDTVRKAVMLVDGKVVDTSSIVELVVKKKTT